MPDIVINPSLGKIDFFTVKGEQVTNSMRLGDASTILFTGALSASSITTGGGGAFVTSVQPTANYLSKFTGNSTIANSLVYDNGTNVGIGTTSPTTKLAVSDGTTIAQVNPSSGVAYFGTVNNYPVALSVNSSEKVRIFSGGSVSFGTTADTLFSAGNIYLNGATGNAAGPVVAFGQSDSVTGGIGHLARITGGGTSQDIFIQSQGASNSIGLNANPSGAAIYFQTQGAEKVRITAGNNADGLVMLPTRDLEVTPVKDLPHAK